jgi:hypothetical protein
LPRNEQIPPFFDLPDRFRVIGEEHPNNAKASVPMRPFVSHQNHLFPTLVRAYWKGKGWYGPSE